MTVADRVWETSTTTGTGTLTLSGAVDAFWQTFAVGLTASEGMASPAVWTNVYYVIYDGTDVEVGKGTVTLVTSSPEVATLTRADVDITYSTDSNNRINWGVGTRNVICSMNAVSFNQY